MVTPFAVVPIEPLKNVENSRLLPSELKTDRNTSTATQKSNKRAAVAEASATNAKKPKTTRVYKGVTIEEQYVWA